MQHIPVLLDAFLLFFQDKDIRCFIDATLGAAGHAKALLEHHPEIIELYGLDQDMQALEIAQETLLPFAEKVHLIHGNFRSLKKHLAGKKMEGIFLDLGVSSMQLDRPEKGFSVYKEGPLDMRMDQTQPLTAEVVINTFSERELGTIFRELGEEPRWRAVAKTLVEVRKKRRIKTTTELSEALKHTLTWGGRRGKKIHPMTLVFQALRIFVNDELKVIEEVIPQVLELLVPGGRLGIITFHSLEDRIVKHTFKRYALEKSVRILTKKPIIADSMEIKRNLRSRSAKMRFVEKCE